MKQGEWICIRCKLSKLNFTPNQKANHSRWCDSNPLKQNYLNQLSNVRHLTQTKESRNKQSESVKQLWKDGAYNSVDYSKFTFKNREHTAATKHKQSEIALKSTHRRLVKSTRKYRCKDGTEILLDSSWEEALAKRLDELNVIWIRPEQPIPWTDTNNNTHNYFPDFFLPKYNIYLDPKNPIAYNVQKSKIDILTKQLPNLIILKTLKECIEFTP